MTYERILGLKCRLCGNHIGHVLMSSKIKCDDDNPQIDKIMDKGEKVLDIICDECYEKVKDNYCN